MRVCRALTHTLLLSTASFVSEAQVIGFDADTEDVETRYRAFIDYLNTLTQAEHQIRIADTYEEASRQLLDCEVSMAILSPFNYVRSARAGGLTLLAALEKNGQRYYGTVVLSNSKDIVALADVQDATFFYPSESSTSGYLLPLTLLRDRGLDIDTLEKQHVDGNQLLAMKMAKQHDGRAIVATSTERYLRPEDTSPCRDSSSMGCSRAAGRYRSMPSSSETTCRRSWHTGTGRP